PARAPFPARPLRQPPRAGLVDVLHGQSRSELLPEMPVQMLCPALLGLRELLRRLATLVPPPRAHLVRYHGVFGPASKWRKEIVPTPSDRKSTRLNSS